VLTAGNARHLDVAKKLGYNCGMQRVKIGEFRDRASELIRRAAGGETVIILNRDRAVAKIVPMKARVDRRGGLIGCLAGTAEIRGDIEAPIASVDTWFSDPS
jgi:antitoxin (DNA-binding transcriptional repressor) of toxin-antitoxin stability system